MSVSSMAGSAGRMPPPRYQPLPGAATCASAPETQRAPSAAAARQRAACMPEILCPRRTNDKGRRARVWQNRVMAIESDRLIAAAPASPQEQQFERSLRPVRLADYVGQAKTRDQLAIFIEAARGRREALDHVLLFGPPGLGKTTLAHIIAREMGVNLRHTSGPVLERAGDLAAILTNLEPNDVLFIDEIHRLSPIVEEILYPA